MAAPAAARRRSGRVLHQPPRPRLCQHGADGSGDQGIRGCIHHFTASAGVDLVHSAKERKDEVTQRYLAGFAGAEGVLYVGRAQEKAMVWRTQRPLLRRRELPRLAGEDERTDPARPPHPGCAYQAYYHLARQAHIAA